MSLISKAFSDIITFSRSSNATRVGSDGTVQYAPHNLCTYSDDLSNAAWTKTSLTVSANVIAAPNGTVTADKLVEAAATSAHGMDSAGATVVTGVTYTGSIYAKAAERRYLILALSYSAFTSGNCVYFDLQTGTIVGFGAGSSAAGSIVSVGNGWYRCSITLTATSGGSVVALPAVYMATSVGSNIPSYAGDGSSGLYVWGAQFSAGSIAGDYTPTTSAAVYGPRFDYDPVTLAAKGLLIEEQRTNLATYSEQLDNAAWGKDGATVTANSVAAPDGTVTADKLVEDTSNNVHNAYQIYVSTVSTTYTLSAYVKKSGRPYSYIRAGGISYNPYAVFNLDTGTLHDSAGLVSSSITALGNGWYRISITVLANSTVLALNVGAAAPGYTLNAGNIPTYTGDGSSGVYIWGAQAEAGAFATSYIPTVASTVTRSADVASVNTLSPWFNATEGTIFADFQIRTGVPYAAIANLFTNFNNEIILTGGTASVGATAFVVISSGSVEANIGSRALSSKEAGTYKANDFAVSTNGATVATDTSGTLPSVTSLVLGNENGSNYLNGWLRRVAYYPRRLTNAELQALTA